MLLAKLKKGLTKAKDGIRHYLKKCQENPIVFYLYGGGALAIGTPIAGSVHFHHIVPDIIKPLSRAIFLRIMASPEISQTGCISEYIDGYKTGITEYMDISQQAVACPTEEILAQTLPRINELLEGQNYLVRPFSFIGLEAIIGTVALSLIAASIHAQFRDNQVAQLPIVNLTVPPSAAPQDPLEQSNQEDSAAINITELNKLIENPQPPRYTM